MPKSKYKKGHSAPMTPSQPEPSGTGVPGLSPKLDPKGESNNATKRQKPSISISENRYGK